MFINKLIKEFNRIHMIENPKNIPLTNKSTLQDVRDIRRKLLSDKIPRTFPQYLILLDIDMLMEIKHIENDIVDETKVVMDLEFNSNLLATLKFKKQLLDKEVENVVFNNTTYNTPFMEAIDILSVSKNSCLVGGCIRDTLMNKVPKDWDFVTDIPYGTMKDLFIEKGFSVKEVGDHFLVLMVTKDNYSFEIANFRKDGTYVDGRRPESVDIGTIFDDAQRRDFTVNALYFNLKNCMLIDPLEQGLDDIENKTLRFVGDAKKRLEEDYLRGLRFYRFLQKGFTPYPQHLRVVRTLFPQIISKTTPERIKNEIEKLVGLGV